MANPEHVEIVKQGAAAIEEWRNYGMDIADLDLSDARLVDANLTGAELSNAGLSGANLSVTLLIGADLSRALLMGANLLEANLSGADLSGANLSGAKFSGAKLSHAELTDANLDGGRFGGTAFANVDLSSVKGLENVRHLGPSTIGIDTLYKSKAQIPEAFLRGCGVPDGLIEYLPSLMGMQEAMQFYSCFISYSHKDEEFCQRLHSRMRDEHLRVWFAPDDMKAGRKIHEQIDQAIRVHDKLLIVLSEASMASEWVETEIYRARQREKKEGKQVLFPIGLAPFEKIKEWEAFDADTGKDMAREAREYFIRDFSDWKDHDSFESAFKRLLKDLRASET